MLHQDCLDVTIPRPGERLSLKSPLAGDYLSELSKKVDSGKRPGFLIDFRGLLHLWSTPQLGLSPCPIVPEEVGLGVFQPTADAARHCSRLHLCCVGPQTRTGKRCNRDTSRVPAGSSRIKNFLLDAPDILSLCGSAELLRGGLLWPAGEGPRGFDLAE